MSWFTERAEAFEEMRAEDMWRVTIGFTGNADIIGISTPMERTAKMGNAIMMPGRTTSFTVLRSEAPAEMRRPGAKVTCNGSTWDVKGVADDPVEPTVDLRCELHV